MSQLLIIAVSSLGGLITFGTAILVLRQRPLDSIKVSFILTALAGTIWTLFNVLTSLSIYFPKYALSLARLSLLGPSFIPSLMLLMVLLFTTKDKKIGWVKIFLIFLPSLIFISLLPTEYNIKNVFISSGVVEENQGILYPAYLAYSAIYLVVSFAVLKQRFSSQLGRSREQIRYLFTGLSLSVIFGVFINVILPNPPFRIGNLAALGPLGILFFILFTAYAIIAHQLFDIRVIIKRTVVYSGLLLFTLVTYSMIIFFFTAVFGGESTLDAKNFIANLIAAMLIAFGFEPLRKWLTGITDHYLFKGEYDPQAVLAELSKELSASVDIHQAMQSLVLLIKSQLRLSRSAVITFKNEETKIVVKDAIQDGYPDPSVIMLPSENLLLQQFARAPQVVITDMLRRDCDIRSDTDPNKQACQMLLVDLEKLGIAMAIPILVDDKAIGMFFVGDKLSGDAFTKNEVEFLTIVANQTANTIEKARFWEEDQMKSEFVSIASHELLTPTAAIKGYLSMILDESMGQIDDTARRYLTKVYSSSDRLAHLVEDLLNVSRIEGGRLKINKRSFSLVESAQKAVEELSVNAKAKSLDLAFVVPPGQLMPAYADPDHIYRVLVNLIGNSIKYTTQGWVRCFVTQYDPTHLLFCVSDSGLGIPQDNIPHLFEKFYRADRREIAGIQGTGLGLYISKKIIDLMGGQMWVQSEVGKGTTFFFTVPVYANQPVEVIESAQAARQVAAASSQPQSAPVSAPAATPTGTQSLQSPAGSLVTKPAPAA